MSVVPLSPSVLLNKSPSPSESAFINAIKNRQGEYKWALDWFGKCHFLSWLQSKGAKGRIKPHKFKFISKWIIYGDWIPMVPGGRRGGGVWGVWRGCSSSIALWAGPSHLSAGMKNSEGVGQKLSRGNMNQCGKSLCKIILVLTTMLPVFVRKSPTNVLNWGCRVSVCTALLAGDQKGGMWLSNDFPFKEKHKQNRFSTTGCTYGWVAWVGSCECIMYQCAGSETRLLSLPQRGENVGWQLRAPLQATLRWDLHRQLQPLQKANGSQEIPGGGPWEKV